MDALRHWNSRIQVKTKVEKPWEAERCLIVSLELHPFWFKVALDLSQSSATCLDKTRQQNNDAKMANIQPQILDSQRLVLA